jgi:hypothetical protein
MMGSPNYSLGDIVIPKANTWKSLHFTMHILKKRNINTKSLAYTSLVQPVPEYVPSCWEPYRKGQVCVLDQMQNKVTEFAHQRNDLNWETLAQHRKITHLWAIFKAYIGERAWKAKAIDCKSHAV